MARRRSLTGELYRAARLSNDRGSLRGPGRAARRAGNSAGRRAPRRRGTERENQSEWSQISQKRSISGTKRQNCGPREQVYRFGPGAAARGLDGQAPKRS